LGEYSSIKLLLQEPPAKGELSNTFTTGRDVSYYT